MGDSARTVKEERRSQAVAELFTSHWCAEPTQAERWADEQSHLCNIHISKL